MNDVNDLSNNGESFIYSRELIINTKTKKKNYTDGEKRALKRGISFALYSRINSEQTDTQPPFRMLRPLDKSLHEIVKKLNIAERRAPIEYWQELCTKDYVNTCEICFLPVVVETFDCLCYGKVCALEYYFKQKNKNIFNFCKVCYSPMGTPDNYLCGETICLTHFITIFKLTRFGSLKITWNEKGNVTEDFEIDLIGEDLLEEL